MVISDAVDGWCTPRCCLRGPGGIRRMARVDPRTRFGACPPRRSGPTLGHLAEEVRDMALGHWVLTDQDVRDLLVVLERPNSAGEGDFFYTDVLAGLRELIPCDDITFQLMDVSEQRLRTQRLSDDGMAR